MTVTGHGAADAVPDRAVADLGAEARAVDAERALGLAAECIDRMRTVLRAAGVEDRALRTTQSSTWTDGSAAGSSRVVARLGLQVTLQDVASAGDLAGAAVSAGGEPARMDGIRFEISDPTQAQADAREAAWTDAVTHATHWARPRGRTLGDVQWVQEGGAEGAPVFLARAKSMSAVPVEPGVQAVTCAVTVRWAWADDEGAAGL